MSVEGDGTSRRAARSRRIRGVALALALAATLPRAGSPQRLPFARFSADHGLAGSQVWAIYQDRRGYLWVATTWGLCRYDGEGFSTFSIPEGLPSPTARTLVEDREGNLWIGTNDGLARYDGHAITAFREAPGLPRATVWASAIDPAGRLWFGTEHGLVSWDGRAFRSFGRAAGLADDYVYALAVTGDDELWVGSRGRGATRCRITGDGGLAGCRIYTTVDGLGSDIVRSIVADARGAIYLATRAGGLSVFAGGGFRTLRSADGLAGDDAYALLLNLRGELVVGSSTAGLSICELPAVAPCRTWNEANNLPDDSVYSLFEDREGSLWIGTEGGLGQLVREDLWSYGARDGLPSDHVYSLANDGAGGLWVGTTGGLAHFRPGAHGEPKFDNWYHADGLPTEWVWSVLRDRAGRVWVGTEEGLCRMRERGGFDVLGAREGLGSGYVYAIAEDHRGDLWAGTTAGLARVHLDPAGRAEVRNFGVADGLAADRAYSLVEDGGGRLWVAHGEGLSVGDGERFHPVEPSPEMPIDSVRVVGLAGDGAVWIGGYGYVARRVAGTDPPRFTAYGADAGFGSALVIALGFDDQGRVLAGTNRGVLVFDPGARLGRGGIVARFGRVTGAIATEVSHSSAFARDAGGRFWFGFKGGMTGFPRDITSVPEPPPPLLFERLTTGEGKVFRAPFTTVSAGGGWLGDEPPELVWPDRNLRAEVRALAYRTRGALRYQFRLEGVDRNWSEAKPEAFREYTNLDPGRYVLRVRAAVGDGPFGPPLEQPFTVRPAWWQNPLVRLLAALAAAGLVVAAATARTRRIALRARQLEGQVAERTDDLARYARALAEHLLALDRANDRIRSADEARRELFAKLSHEIRAPLTAILGFSELLEERSASLFGDRERRYLVNLREGGQQLLRLVNNFLDQAKLDAGRMDLHLEPVALESVIESVAALMEGYALQRRVEIDARLAADLPTVASDLAKLRQILTNLLSNAIKFSPPESRVEVRAETLDAARSPLGVASFSVAVRDAGPGVAPGERERIFEPFRQAAGVASAGSVAGTGLGLPIARQFATLLGGTIELESEVGAGSTFRVVLPVDPLARPAAGVAAPDAVDGRHDTLRVVAIEPDRRRFAALAEGLEREGFLAVRAADPAEADRMLREIRPFAALLRLDSGRSRGAIDLGALAVTLPQLGIPLVLQIATAPDRGWALGFDRALASPTSTDVLGEALAALAAASAPAPRSLFVLASAGSGLLGIARRAVDSEPLIPRNAEEAMALARESGVRAALLDPRAGAWELARELQSERELADLPWLLLLPRELPVPEPTSGIRRIDEREPPLAGAAAAILRRLAQRRGVPSGA
jgi:signal transduction histidine kinase/ligand-binding sensor domain-containing protein